MWVYPFVRRSMLQKSYPKNSINSLLYMGLLKYQKNYINKNSNLLLHICYTPLILYTSIYICSPGAIEIFGLGANIIDFII